jgi:hypothetical protein
MVWFIFQFLFKKVKMGGGIHMEANNGGEVAEPWPTTAGKSIGVIRTTFIICD